MIDFYEEAFEEHLHAATSNLKEGFSHSSCSSETSAASLSEFASYLRTGNEIKDASTILDKAEDLVLHLDSKDIGKTSAKVFETESNDSKPKTSCDFTCS